MTTADTTGLRLTRIGQIAVPVTNLPAAVEFYRDVLGMPLLFEAPPGLAFFDCGGVRLMLDASPEAQGGQFRPLIYYSVAEIGAAAATLEGRGVSFESPPHRVAKLPDHELWMAFFRDPDENLIGLMSEVRA